jgi:hypothetical protein
MSSESFQTQRTFSSLLAALRKFEDSEFHSTIFVNARQATKMFVRLQGMDSARHCVCGSVRAARERVNEVFGPLAVGFSPSNKYQKHRHTR